MLYIVTLLPPIIFVLLLVWLDSFSLVKTSLLVSSFVWGCFSVAVAYLCITIIGKWSDNLFAAPIIEEGIKGMGIVILIRMRKCAFFIDAAIYGAAIGAGFSFIENIVYIYYNPDMLLGTMLIRGFGTAIMHCGCVISTATLLSWYAGSKNHFTILYCIAPIPAIVFHTIYNAVTIQPILLLLVTIVSISLWTILLFSYNEKSIGKWMDDELSAEVTMLTALKQGHFSASKTGQYMLSIKEQFAPECYFDMFCYVRLYYELSLASKTNMMRAEAGFPVIKNKDDADKVNEFYILRKRIGKTAVIALSPIIKSDQLASWKINSMA